MMSKFIEITDHNRRKHTINTAHVIRMGWWGDKRLAELYIEGVKYEFQALESYEEVKAMLMYDPAVADIVRQGERNE
jgi:hypothetical protein